MIRRAAHHERLSFILDTVAIAVVEIMKLFLLDSSVSIHHKRVFHHEAHEGHEEFKNL
jgi:hypothetical protein